jgi:type 1 glutamine amidotransferase
MRRAVATMRPGRYRAGMLLALLAAAVLQPPSSSPQSPPLNAVVITGQNNHDWQWTAPEIAGALRETGRFATTVVEDPAVWLPGLEQRVASGEVHVLVLDYNGPRWGDAAERAFLAAVENGLGVSVVHAANNAFPGWTEYERLVGLLWRQGTGHGNYHTFDVHVVDHHHPVTRGMQDLRRHPDELYHHLWPAPGSDHRVLLSAYSAPETRGTGRHEPMATAGSFGKGRIFHTPLGHVWRGVPQSRATWADPQLRRLVARGTEWAATGEVTLRPEPLDTLAPAEAAEGFALLFDGRSLAGWRRYRGEGPPTQGWVVRDAAIVHEARGGGGDLLTEAQYGDFDFRFEFRVAPRANSGVLWHVQEDAAEPYMSGPEYQVLDDEGAEPAPQHSVAALYDLVAPTGKTARPAGAWNEGRIVVQGGRVEHWLNGVRVVEAPCRGEAWDAMVAGSKFRNWPFGKAGAGHLALQDHGDEVAWRNLRIKRL